MNKKLSMFLVSVLLLGIIPVSTVEAINLPFGYDLYEDTHPKQNISAKNIQERIDNVNSEMEKMDKQLKSVEKIMKINQSIQELNKDKSISEEEKLKKLKSYNDDLKNILNTDYKDQKGSDFEKAKKILDTNDKLFATIENNNLSEEEKMNEMSKFQKEYITILNEYNNSNSITSGGERNADLRRSSRKRYADSKKAPNWTIDQPFFNEVPDFINPSMSSIREKYHLGNFTGCMQEAEAYVRKNPNDTFGFYYLAMSYAKSGDKENAIKAYEKVISLHDSPIIVKYATNGRNCVMNGKPDKCYENVNLPDYVYPYAKEATPYNLTPVDADTLVQKNLAKVEAKMTSAQDSQDDKDKDKKDEKSKNTKREIFSKQDEALDRFIKAPYGNGFSPELNTEYKKQQLKRLKDSINKEQEGAGSYFNNFNNVRNFDKNKSEADDASVKIALNDFDDKAYMNDPEYIQAQKEMKQIEMMFGSSSKKSNDLVDLLPSLIEQGNGNNIPPELMKTMVTNSMMTDIVDTSF